MSRTKVDAPDYIQFYPTLRCNYSCSFCFNRGIAGTGDIAIEAFEKIANICRISGAGHIDILGGEPTLHPDLEKLLSIICKNRLTTTISTNGSAPEKLFYLSEKFSGQNVQIGISINESRVSKKLHQYILDRQPIVKTVYTDSDDPEQTLSPYIQIPETDTRLIFRDAADCGDLENCPSFESFSNRLTELKNLYPGLKGVFCGGFIPDTKSYPELENTRCPAGTTKLSVLCDGSVYPCYLFFRYNRFYLGNILKDDFSEIWNHPVLDFFRNFSGNPCKNHSCRFYRDCRGGCPAMSYLAYSRPDQPDPRCLNHKNIKEKAHAPIYRP
ncbi:MAG: radical SAM protein [Desulfobacteraceae bacterium]|nr:radical SAM protein [Desulfobacteraceae bacterium]